MKLIIEDEGISLLENKGQYYLQYDAGAHMIKKKRIEITNEEAELCQLDVKKCIILFCNIKMMVYMVKM